MAEQFDPYRKWLGIPPEEQPPNHYRLLGIGLYEADDDVIQEAADRQMSHVQRHKLGQYAAVSQKLLNELSGAKLCLLKPDQKAAYDRQLRQKLAVGIPPVNAAGPAPPVAVSQPPVAIQRPAIAPVPVNQAVTAPLARPEPIPASSAAYEADESTADFSVPDTLPRRRKGRTGSSKNAASNRVVLGGAVAAGIAVVVGIVAMSGGTKAPPTALSVANKSSSRSAEESAPAPKPQPSPVAQTPTTDARSSTESGSALPAAPPESPAPAGPTISPPEPLAPAATDVADLLPLIRVGTKTAIGKWQKSKKGLTLLASDNPFPRVVLPYAPPEEYQLELIVEPQPAAEVILGLVAGGKQCVAMLDGWGGSTSGITRIDDKGGNENESTHSGSVLTPRQPNQVLITVRKDSIQVASNGASVIDWHGSFGRLSLPPWAQDIPDKRALFVGGATGTAFRIRSLRLITISGHGQELTEPVVDAPAVARVESPSAADAPPPAPSPDPAGPKRAHFELHNNGFILSPFQALAVGSDSRLLATSGYLVGQLQNLQFWDLAKHRAAGNLYANRGRGQAVIFSPNSERMFVGTPGRVVTFLKIDVTNFANGPDYSNLGERPVYCLSVSADGRLLAGGGPDGLAVWDTNADPDKPSFKWHHPRDEQVTAVAFALEGKWLLVGCGGTCDFDGDRSYHGGQDHKLRAWDVTTGQTKEVEGHRGGIWSIAVSRDGSRAATASEDGTVRIWDTKTLRSRPPLAGHDGPVYTVAISPDGQLVASGGADKTVRIWNAGTGKETDRFTGHTALVRAVALTPDGKFVISGAEDQSIRGWELGPQTAGPIAALTPSPPAKNRTVAPAKPDVEEATKLIRDVFADDYKQAKKPADRLALAEKLLAQSNQSQNDTERYALLSEARSLAIAGDSPALAIQIIEQTGSRFEIDIAREAAELVEQPTKDSLPPAVRKEMAEALLPLAEAAIARSDYEIARRLLTAASQSARKSNDAALVKQIAARGAEVNDARKLLDAYNKAIENLKTSPEDADENLAVGKYLCFVKQDWDKGLPHLAKGSDQTLKQIAGLELQAPSNPEDQIKIGDLWWTLVELAKGKEKADYADRCEKWYGTALPGLKGLSQTKVSKRIEELGAMHRSSGASSDGGQRTGGMAMTSKGLSARLRTAIKKDLLTRTALLGRGSGNPFVELPPAGVVLVGFNYSLDDQNRSLASIQPIYLTAKGPTNGTLLGVPVGESKTVLADKGYAVSGIRGDASYSVFGFEVIFKKLAANGLDNSGSYNSPWIGFTNTFRARTTIGDNDQPAIGIFGQVNDRISTFGLIQPMAK